MNWMSVFQLVIMFASAAIAWIVFYYVKELPKFHKDYLRDFREAKRELEKDSRQFKNSRQLQIESYFRMQGGNSLETLFKDWTELMMDMDKMKNMNPKKFINLQERTIVYGSDRTINLLSAYQAENYETPQGQGSIKAIVFIAMVICSLKRDFTGFSIEPQTLMKMKINDYSENSVDVDKYVAEIKQSVNWE
jgi:hypothetical protein